MNTDRERIIKDLAEFQRIAPKIRFTLIYQIEQLFDQPWFRDSTIPSRSQLSCLYNTFSSIDDHVVGMIEISEVTVLPTKTIRFKSCIVFKIPMENPFRRELTELNHLNQDFFDVDKFMQCKIIECNGSKCRESGENGLWCESCCGEMEYGLCNNLRRFQKPEILTENILPDMVIATCASTETVDRGLDDRQKAVKSKIAELTSDIEFHVSELEAKQQLRRELPSQIDDLHYFIKTKRDELKEFTDILDQINKDIQERDEKQSKEKLLSEKQTLEARLKEIDKLIE